MGVLKVAAPDNECAVDGTRKKSVQIGQPCQRNILVIGLVQAHRRSGVATASSSTLVESDQNLQGLSAGARPFAGAMSHPEMLSVYGKG